MTAKHRIPQCEDKQRDEGLATALPHDIDECLDATPDAIGQRYEQEFVDGAVERVTQTAVCTLGQQSRDQTGYQRQSDATKDEQRGQQGQAHGDIEPLEYESDQPQLGEKRYHVGRKVDPGEEAAEVFRGHEFGHGRFEDEIRQRHRGSREQGEYDDGPGIGVANDIANSRTESVALPLSDVFRG